jgi:hypothetical protein
MAQASFSQEQLIDLVTKVALLTQQVQLLTETVSTQEQEIKTLIALVERGKGSIWILMLLGAAAGAAISNAKMLLSLLLRA